jgi:NifU-like protein
MMLDCAEPAPVEAHAADEPRATPPRGIRLVGLDRRPAIVKAPASPPRPVRRLDNAERVAAIESALAELRPRLRMDGGDCELVDIVEDVVRVRLTGACVGCQLASMTVLGVRMRLIEKLGFPVKVVPV